jgi:hypothetical protein
MQEKGRIAAAWKVQTFRIDDLRLSSFLHSPARATCYVLRGRHFL